MMSVALLSALVVAAPAEVAPTTAAAAPAVKPAQLKSMMRNMHRVGEAQAQVAQPVPIKSSWGRRAISLLGIGVMIVLALLLSDNRRSVPWRLVGLGCALQLVFGLLVLKTDAGSAVFGMVNGVGFVPISAKALYSLNIGNGAVTTGAFTTSPTTSFFVAQNS